MGVVETCTCWATGSDGERLPCARHDRDERPLGRYRGHVTVPAPEWADEWHPDTCGWSICPSCDCCIHCQGCPCPRGCDNRECGCWVDHHA